MNSWKVVCWKCLLSLEGTFSSVNLLIISRLSKVDTDLGECVMLDRIDEDDDDNFSPKNIVYRGLSCYKYKISSVVTSFI